MSADKDILASLSVYATDTDDKDIPAEIELATTPETPSTTPEDIADGVLIYDQDEATLDEYLIAVLTVSSYSIAKELSKPGTITIQIPNSDPLLDETFTDVESVVRPIIDLGQLVKVYRAGNLDATGYIVGPLNKATDPVTITAMGIATRLERYRLPVLWNIEDAPDEVLRALLKEYRFYRLTTISNFNAGAYSDTQLLELGTAGDDRGAVMLAYDAGGAPPYKTSGYWQSAEIDMGTGLTAWRKIKFKAGFGVNQTLTFQTRSHAPAGGWSGWTGAVDIDEWCEDGYAITSAAEQYLQVQINFATADDEISPVVEAVEIQGTYGDIMAEGTGFNTLPTETISYNVSYVNQLDAIATLVAEQEYEWEEAADNKINVALSLGVDRTGRFGLHEYVHFEMLDFEEDDADLINYVIGLGTGVGLDQLTAIAQDTDSIARYGKRVGLYETALETQASNLADAATVYLNEYKTPTRYIRIRVIDTPDGTFDFEPGDTLRLLSETRSLDEDFRIYRVVRQFSDRGYEVELTLTNPHPRGKSFIQEYLREQQEFALAADSAIKNFDSSDLWTDWIAADDVTWNQLTIQLGFTPTDGHIVALQILEYATGYYTQPEAQIDYRIRDLRTGEMEIEYRRTEVGSNAIRIQFLWKAWSRRRTFSAIGVGGQIE